jgi:hypothetical protein
LLCLSGLVALNDAPLRAEDPPKCTWTGAKNNFWKEIDNWMCSGGFVMPTSETDVDIASGNVQVILVNGGSARNLNLNGARLQITGGPLQLAGEAFANGVNEIATGDDFNGPLTVQTGTTDAGGFGAFLQNIVVEFAAALRPIAQQRLMVNGDLTVNGTLGSNSKGFVSFHGATFVNDGTVAGTDFRFDHAGVQHYGGSGVWNGGEFYVDDVSTVMLESAAAMNSVQLTVWEGGTLSIGPHLMNAEGVHFMIRPNATVAGGGALRTNTGVRIDNNSVFSPSLNLVGGVTWAGGIGAFTGPISITQATELHVITGTVLIVEGDLTADGLIVAQETAALRFGGGRFVNNNTPRLPLVQFTGSSQTLQGAVGFSGGPQILQGVGSFSATTTARIEAGVILTLASDHQFGKLETASGAGVNPGVLNATGRTASLSAPGTALLNEGRIITASSTIIYNGVVTQSVNTSSMKYHNLTLNNPTLADAASSVFPLFVENTLRVQAGKFYSGDCQCGHIRIDQGAEYRTTAGGLLHLTGNWTNDGAFQPGDDATVVFAGASAQTIGGGAQTAFPNLTLENAQGVTLTNDIIVSGTLTLNSELYANGHTVYLANTAIVTGAGEIIGAVQRTGPFTLQTPYTFNNAFTSIRFDAGLPNVVTVTLTRESPSDLPSAIHRVYAISSTQGNGFSATLRLHYRTEDLGDAAADTLQLWRRMGGQAQWQAMGRSAASVTQQWVQQNGIAQFSEWSLAPGPWIVYVPVVHR